MYFVGAVPVDWTTMDVLVNTGLISEVEPETEVYVDETEKMPLKKAIKLCKTKDYAFMNGYNPVEGVA